jgi:hypothetical protein
MLEPSCNFIFSPYIRVGAASIWCGSDAFKVFRCVVCNSHFHISSTLELFNSSPSNLCGFLHFYLKKFVQYNTGTCLGLLSAYRRSVSALSSCYRLNIESKLWLNSRTLHGFLYCFYCIPSFKSRSQALRIAVSGTSVANSWQMVPARPSEKFDHWRKN